MLLRDWHWDRCGVTIEAAEGEELHLRWYEDLGPVAFASGAAVEQTFEDFRANGPAYSEVPDDVLAEVRAIVG